MTVVSAAVLVAACSGGGGVASGGSTAPPVATTPVPTPTPTPVVTPTPSPTPTPSSSADTAEYRASGAAVLARTAYAYDRGITGRGVTVAILDTGIDTAGSEFRGRVSADSTGFDQRIARCATCPAETIRFDVKDVIGHGTRVAGIAAAARDGVGVQGVAPEATILALKISGADLSAVTPTFGAVPESGNPNAQLIGPAIRYAVEKGAFVINLSANGGAGGTIATDQRAAMDAVRAADRLVVQSVSNSDGQDSFTGQWAENLVGADRANKDWFLFAVALDPNGVPRAANGNAGPLADRMIAAAGNGVATVDKDGAVVTEIGNSFAAPAVSGAAALLKQYWPQLGGRAIARILLDTARDAGPTGVDQVYGVGILDVENAMRAQATTTQFAAAEAALGRWSSLVVSAPFGGSAGATKLGGAVASMMVFDRYGRDYRMMGGSGVRASSSGLLATTMLPLAQPLWLRDATSGDARLGAFSTGSIRPWQNAVGNQPAVVSFSPADGQTVTLGANVGVGTSAGLAGSPLRGIGVQPVGLTSSWQGRGWSAGFSSGVSRDRVTTLDTVSLVTPSGFGLEVARLRERNQLLGLRGSPGGDLGGDTTLVTLIGERLLAGVALSARATFGSTRPRGGSASLSFTTPLLSSAFSVEGSRRLFGGLATVGLASPLRVERARAVVLTPVAYDLVTGALTEERRKLDLTPTARELDLSLGWAAALSPGAGLRLGIVHALNAGHVSGASDTAGFLTLSIR